MAVTASDTVSIIPDTQGQGQKRIQAQCKNFLWWCFNIFPTLGADMWSKIKMILTWNEDYFLSKYRKISQFINHELLRVWSSSWLLGDPKTIKHKHCWQVWRWTSLCGLPVLLKPGIEVQDSRGWAETEGSEAYYMIGTSDLLIRNFYWTRQNKCNKFQYKLELCKSINSFPLPDRHFILIVPKSFILCKY